MPRPSRRGFALPGFLAPVQVAVVPVAPAQQAAAALVAAALREAGLRVELDDRNETLARRVAEAHANGVPFVAVVGAREVEGGTLALRSRAGQKVLARAEAAAMLARECAPPL